MYPDNLTRAETRARANLIEVERYEIELDLTGSEMPAPDAQFRSRTTISFAARRAGALHVDLIADAMSGAALDGRPLPAAAFSRSRLPINVEPGPHELSVEAICRYSRTGEGLHRFVDPVDERTYLYTQFEPADARRMFACFEQPDLKARFALTVRAPEGWLVVANGAERERTSLGDGTTRWTFAETERISTYLTGLVAGDYVRVERPYAAAAGPLALGLICRASLAEHLDADRLFGVTEDGFGVFEDTFGVGYPFGKYDQAFVPEYNGGAMENVGLVTVRDEYLFRSRATTSAYQTRDDTLLHELSHMWFGDLVTMRWWDDLWLKESFATWASNFATSELAEDPDTAWATFTNGFKSWAYRQDQLPSTHPIAADIVDLEAVEQNFDGITYAKGASVLIQLVAYVGRDAFVAGVRRYFAEHAYGNTELADLLGALSAASGRDLATWSSHWLETTGVNTLRPAFEVQGDGRFSDFAVEQEAAPEHPTLRPHRIAIGLYDRVPADAGVLLRRVDRVETDVTGARTPVPELVGRRRPDLVLVNDDDLSYAKVRLDPGSLQTVLERLPELESPLARAVCWALTWDMCRDAELSAAAYVDLALRGLPNEPDATAVTSVLAQGQSAARHYTPLVDREAVLIRWQDGIADLLAEAEAGSDLQLALAKAFPLAAEDEAAGRRLTAWLVGEELPAGLVVDPELRWSVVRQLARLGLLGDDEISDEAHRDPTITGAEQAAAARAARPTCEAKAAAWRLVTADDSVPNGTQRAVCLAFWQSGQDDVLAPYVEQYLEMAADIDAGRGGWAGRGHALRSNALRFLFPVPGQLEPFLARLDDWLSEHDVTDSVRRPLVEGRDNALRALRCQRA